MIKQLFSRALAPFRTATRPLRKRLANHKKLKQQLDLAAELEQQIESDPTNVQLRDQIINCYHKACVYARFGSLRQAHMAKKHSSHVLWFIIHAAEQPFITHPHLFWPTWSTEDRNKIKNAWLSQIEKYPDNVWVLTNASWFLNLTDKEKAEGWAWRAHTLAPDNFEVSARLAKLLDLKAFHLDPEEQMETRSQVLQIREEAMKLMPEDRRHEELRHVIKDAFNVADYVKAQKYAEELIELAKSEYWDAANVFHLAHVMLGRIAIKNGDLEEAKKQLLLAGSPPMGLEIIPAQFDSNSELIAELAERNESNTVDRYFSARRKYKNELPEKWKAV